MSDSDINNERRRYELDDVSNTYSSRRAHVHLALHAYSAVNAHKPNNPAGVALLAAC